MNPIASLVAAALLMGSSMLTSLQQAEVKRIENRLLASCCYSQPIAQHISGAAEEMRHEVEQMVAQGRPESQIIDHYKRMYGQRILAVPDGTTGTVLFALPVFATAVSLTVLAFFLRKMLQRGLATRKSLASQPPIPLDPKLRDRIDRDLQDLF